MDNQVFPEDITCIVTPTDHKGGIFISNIEAASNPNTLKRLGIGAVITAIKGKNLADIVPKSLEYLYVPAVDSEAFDIKQFFTITNQFLSEELTRTNVLVHCMAGVSRSVTLVIAYQMFSRNCSYESAFSYVKQKRPIICPNESFIQQLQQYELQLKKGNIPKQIQNKKGKDKMKRENFKSENYYEKIGYDIALKQNISRVFAHQTKNNVNVNPITRQPLRSFLNS